ncbi:MAG: sigma 54-interacting transcriptional regulator [Deltaproteobacteria bacterium]|nr:sigma 54-interacting transcriptional regulator [Deltaproteobacteria bacterium]
MKIGEYQFFREATYRICSHLDIEKAMSSCLQFLQQIIPADRMGLHLYERDLGSMRTVAFAKAFNYKKMDTIISLPPEARTVMENDISKGVVIINQLEKNLVGVAMARFHNLKESSLLVMTLVIEGRRLGSLTLVGEGRDRYTDEHARLYSLLHDPFVIAMANTLRHKEVVKLKDILADDNQYLRKELRRQAGHEIVGENLGLKKVMEMVRQVAHLDSPVLLLGETGVGKEVIGSAIHSLSPRKKGPFIKVNSGAIPETLVDSELFGHEKGAFTGALSKKRGRFERAHEGTIFLDEISELPPQVQIRMLRVLQEREIERVGGSKTIPLDIRIIAATNRDLLEMVKSHQFREDLWFRFNVFPISIPPLRERKEDIPALVNYFIDRKAKDLKLHSSPKLASGAIDRLMAYHWPGNVRELENMVERALILHKGGTLEFESFILGQQEQDLAVGNGDLDFDTVMAKHIQRVLKMTGGKVHGPGGAAEMLSINPSTLRYKMKKFGITS